MSSHGAGDEGAHDWPAQPGPPQVLDAAAPHAVEPAISGEPFAIAELPGVDEAGAVDVTRKLFAFGLIERA